MPWTRVAARADFGERTMMSVRCPGHRLALYVLEGGLYATNDACPHLGASLSMGCMVQGWVECPMHHALFDIRTGAPDGSVTDRILRTYPAKVDGGEIYVDLPAEEQAS